MKAFCKKLTSRKFLAAVAGFVAGLAMVFKLDEGIISTVTGAVTAVGSAMIYIVTEGEIDAAAARNTAMKVQAAMETMTE